jgi:2-oxo-4-hydroxy-4-carboxy-5-ureidoimidazoline decarboxylase
MTFSLDEVNDMDRTAFVMALGFVFERSPWVVRRAHAAGPFATRDALLEAMLAVLAAAHEDDRLDLIRAHPELAGKAAIAGTLTAESRIEQASAGLDQLTVEEFQRFHALNAAYHGKFDFPFIICVRMNDKASILDAMERRLDNGRAAEIAEAIVQVGLIAGLRLNDAVTP